MLEFNDDSRGFTISNARINYNQKRIAQRFCFSTFPFKFIPGVHISSAIIVIRRERERECVCVNKGMENMCAHRNVKIGDH